LKADLARLNHVLIPATKSGRDRYRNGRFARHLRPIAWLFARLTREGRVLLGAVCFALFFSGDVVRTESHVLVLGCASLLLVSLVFTRAYRLDGVVVEVHAPPRVTVGDQLAVTVSLRNRDDGTEHRAIRIERPLLPWDGTWIGESPRIAELAPGGRASSVARARFIARGEHHIDPFRAVALLPLGLSQGAPVRTDGARFVVVPKVARVKSITVGANPRQQPGGVARSSRTGAATDLLGVRPYRAGDPVRDLHARSWARHGVPVVREYQEESFARIGVVVDSDVSTTTGDHFEAALSLAAGVIANLCEGEALVDVLVVGEYARRLPSGRGLALLDQAMDVLAVAEPGRPFSAAATVAHLRPHLDRLSSIVLIALAWDDARTALAAAIRARGASCRVLVVGDRTSHGPHATTVARHIILAGEALSL
jgi:uncharacterized protein (DUF58 family)